MRAGGKSLGRRIYLACFVALIGWLCLELFGPLIFLDADGLVLKERQVVAPDYTGRVLAVYVKPGDHVTPGTRIALMQSSDTADRLADLVSKRATFLARESQIAARLGAIASTLPSARERKLRAAQNEAQVEALDKQGFGDADKQSDSQRNLYEAEREIATLESEKKSVEEKLISATRLLPSALERQKRARENREKLASLARQGLTTTQRDSEAAREFYDAERELSQLQGELDAARGSITRIASLLPTAYARKSRTLESQSQLILLRSQNLNGVQRQSETAREIFEAELAESSLKAEQAALENEITTLVASRQEIDALITEMRKSYDGGRITSSYNGTVGARVPDPGQVMKRGDTVAEIHYGETHVLASIPTNRLYGLSDGDHVIVTDGAIRRSGRIERLLLVTSTLPVEFQPVFKSAERQQVMRIVFNDDPPFPILSKVRVVSTYGPSSMVALARSLFGAMTGAAIDRFRFALIGNSEDAILTGTSSVRQADDAAESPLPPIPAPQAP